MGRKNRERLKVYLEILVALRDQPRLPTKLAQAVNINYDRLQGLLLSLEKEGYVQREKVDGHEIWRATEKGVAAYQEWERTSSRLDALH